MSKVAVVTDSTAYIPADISIGLEFTIIPLQLIWGDEQYQDGVDIQPVEFYKKLAKAEIMPSTSQSTPGTFKEV
jgi:fatty acid-binding protein DegV